jgi:poly-gamma-glutamate synthesis protein (capsule biosynthesis protein)
MSKKRLIKNIFIKKAVYIPLFMAVSVLTFTGCGNGENVYTVNETSARQSDEQMPETEYAAEGTHTDEDVYSTADEVSVIMAGDILLHTPVEESAVQQDGSISFETIFENTEDEISSADLAIVNQEVIIGGSELGISGYPAFNAPYEIGDALVGAGFDVVCHATNHALDKGKRGIVNCLNFWSNSYPEIGIVGIYEDESDSEDIYIYECNNIKIAILNYTYGTNGIALPEDMPYAVNLLSEEKVAEDIKKAEAEADFTIVCPHWGTEYSLSVTAEQEKWTKIFYENGADLVIGTHPHVIEPIEWWGEDDGRKMLVYYSIGNYVNWTSGIGDGVADRMVGGLAQITVKRDENGEVYIDDYGIEPIVSHVEEGINGVTVYRLSDYTEELADRNAIVNQDAEFSLDYCKNLCSQIWGELSK